MEDYRFSPACHILHYRLVAEIMRLFGTNENKHFIDKPRMIMAPVRLAEIVVMFLEYKILSVALAP